MGVRGKLPGQILIWPADEELRSEECGACGDEPAGRFGGDMTQIQLDRLNSLIASKQEHKFYLWAAWIQKCRDIKRIDHNECQICKAKGRYRKGTIVHHVKHLKDRPDLALSLNDPDTGERQLILVCKQCHEDVHPESFRKKRWNSQPITEERWD